MKKNSDSKKLKELKEAVSSLYNLIEEFNFQLDDYELHSLASLLDDLEIYLTEEDQDQGDKEDEDQVNGDKDPGPKLWH